MPPSPSKFQGNPSGRGGSTAVDVSDADGKLCYSVPKRHISHYGVDGGGGRLVACRNFTAAIEQQLGGKVPPAGDRSASAQSTNSNSNASNNSRNSHHNSGNSYGNANNANNCPMGHRCKFVHIDVPLSSLRSEAIHTHFVWRDASLVTYDMLPPIIAKEQPQLSEKEISETLLTVFGPNNREPSEKIRADRVLMTRGARFAYEAAIGCPRTEDAPPCCHCAHYYFNQVCNRGPNCAFVHVTSINPTLSETHIKTSNFHRRISLLGEENLYSNGAEAPASTTPINSSRPSPQVSRQPSLQRSNIVSKDEGDSAHHVKSQSNANNKSSNTLNSGRGRSTSLPLTSADEIRGHQRLPSTGSIQINPSLSSTPRLQVHLPNLPPVALGSTPNDPFTGEDDETAAPPPPPQSQRGPQQLTGSPPPPPASSIQHQRARNGSGVSSIGRGVGATNQNNTSNNSFMSFNNPPTNPSTPSASRRVSIGPSAHEATGEPSAPAKIAGNRSASSSMVGVAQANAAATKKVDDSPPPPPPSQLVRQPSLMSVGSNHPQQSPQQTASVRPHQQQYDYLPQGAEQVNHGEGAQISYDDGFNANYQDYMMSHVSPAAPSSNASAPKNIYYNSNYYGNGGDGGAGVGYFNNAEYSHGGPGYYQPPPTFPAQQQNPNYGTYPPQLQMPPQQIRSPNPRLQSPSYKPAEHYPLKAGMPPPPSYESSFGHLSLGSRPTSPYPPQYQSHSAWDSAAPAQGGSANNRQPPPPPIPQALQQQHQSSPPYPQQGAGRSNITAIYINNNSNSGANPMQPLGSNSASAPSLPSPISIHVQPIKSNTATLSGYGSGLSEDHPSPDKLNSGALGDGHGVQHLSTHSSAPSRTGSAILSDNTAMDKNADEGSTATPMPAMDGKTTRYVHNPYSGGSNGPVSRSRNSSMIGTQPQLTKQQPQLPPAQVYVTENQVW